MVPPHPSFCGTQSNPEGKQKTVSLIWKPTVKNLPGVGTPRTKALELQNCTGGKKVVPNALSIQQNLNLCVSPKNKPSNQTKPKFTNQMIENPPKRMPKPNLPLNLARVRTSPHLVMTGSHHDKEGRRHTGIILTLFYLLY